MIRKLNTFLFFQRLCAGFILALIVPESHLFAQFPLCPMKDVIEFQFYRKDLNENKVSVLNYTWGSVKSRLEYDKDGFLTSFLENYITEHSDTTTGYILLKVEEKKVVNLVMIPWNWLENRLAEPFTTETLEIRMDDRGRLTGVRRFRPIEPDEEFNIPADIKEKLTEIAGNRDEIRNLVRELGYYSKDDLDRTWEYEWNAKGQLERERREINIGAGNFFFREIEYSTSYDPKGKINTILMKENVNDLNTHQNRFDYSFNRKGILLRIIEFSIQGMEGSMEEVNDGIWHFSFHDNGLLKMARNWKAMPRFQAEYEYFK